MGRDERVKNRIGVIVIFVALALGAFYMAFGIPFTGDGRVRFEPDNPTIVSSGAVIYADACASCHGDDLEGQADWQVRKAEGKLPAPPHDDAGHTWHHQEQQLFDITKLGVQHFAGADYATDMPAFGDEYSDEDILAVLSYIKSTWPPEIRERHDLMSKQNGD